MDFAKQNKPATSFNDKDLNTIYWIKDNQIYYRNYPLKNVDVETFVFYHGSFAKDKNNCYRQNSKLRDANPQTFRALNYTFFKDEKSVWALGGKLQDADPETFEVCDDGAIKILSSNYLPYGFGKDKDKVFYYDFDGKTNWVRKANPETFISLQDGYFGKDDSFAFYGRAAIPKANIKYWNIIDGFYSKDDSKIFYINRIIKTADYSSFEVTSNKTSGLQLAKDKNNFYWNDNVISQNEYIVLTKNFPNLL